MTAISCGRCLSSEARNLIRPRKTPASGRTRPAMMASSVLLPVPDFPMMLMKHGRSLRLFLLVAALTMTAVVALSCSYSKPSLKSRGYEAVGLASYYGRKFHGRRTASGERFNMHAMTAAHRGLKFGTRVEK